MSETRTVYRWTEEQLERAGWRLIHVTTESDRVGSQREAYRKGSVVVMRDYSDGVRGAYLPEPPPPEELSDEEIGGMIVSLRRPIATSAELYAADVIEAALMWDADREKRPYGIGPHSHERNEEFRRHLRRRPHQ